MHREDREGSAGRPLRADNLWCAHPFWSRVLAGCMCLLWRRLNRGRLWENGGQEELGRDGGQERARGGNRGETGSWKRPLESAEGAQCGVMGPQRPQGVAKICSRPKYDEKPNETDWCNLDGCVLPVDQFLCMCVRRSCRTVQGRPSTVASLNSSPTVKVMLVVRTVVEVLMVIVSPSCVISTSGFEAAFTAIIRSIMFTPAEK